LDIVHRAGLQIGLPSKHQRQSAPVCLRLDPGCKFTLHRLSVNVLECGNIEANSGPTFDISHRLEFNRFNGHYLKQTSPSSNRAAVAAGLVSHVGLSLFTIKQLARVPWWASRATPLQAYPLLLNHDRQVQMEATIANLSASMQRIGSSPTHIDSSSIVQQLVQSAPMTCSSSPVPSTKSSMRDWTISAMFAVNSP
jgi:hypothetical protein